MKRSLTLATALLLMLAACSPATLSVSNAWSRPTPIGNTAAAYFTLQNGRQVDALVGASSDIAATVEVHENVPADEAGDMSSDSSMDMSGDATAEPAEGMDMSGTDMGADVMIMQPVPRLELAPDQQVTFEPGGYHVMLIGLTQDLNSGDTFILTLHFEKAGDVDVTVTVQDQ